MSLAFFEGGVLGIGVEGSFAELRVYLDPQK